MMSVDGCLTLSRSLSKRKVPKRQEWIWSARVKRYLREQHNDDREREGQRGADWLERIRSESPRRSYLQ